MLSTENPSSDPSCPCDKISQLKSASDEKASDKVDLLKSGLDDNNPFPNFSIRDYVFSARGKDINTNWPFSQKNLQLCLKHGVKDLLPPFHPLESVRNRSFERFAVQTSPIEKENISNLDGELSGPTDDFVSTSSDNPGFNQKLAVDCVNIGSSGSERDKQLPSTTTDQSHSQIDSVDRRNQTVLKKCRLVVKVGNGSDPSLKEDTLTNSVALSEAMASKVCPVCKNFSSSSNTTLNAHIDQCLSLESTMKWPPNSPVIKHRIKPRKTRLMVDIYATAPHCTLEELDRRNGTNWAMNSSLPNQEMVGCSAQEEKQRASPVNFKNKGDEEGAVYIDANGTKVRILSKFIDTSSVPQKEDLGSRKTSKGGSVSTYKKKHQARKHHKYLKLDQQSKQFCCSKSGRTAAEVCGEKERNFAMKEDCRKEGSPTGPFKAREQITPNDSRTMMKWASSKRTSLLKRHNPQHLGCNGRQELPLGSDQSSLGDSYMERSFFRKNPNLYDSPLSSPESSKRMEKSSFQTSFNDCSEDPPVRKRAGFTSFGSQISETENFSEPSKLSVKKLRIDSTHGNFFCKGFANNGESYAPFVAEGKSSHDVAEGTSHRAFPSKATKFSSLRKHLSVTQSSMPKSKHKVNKKVSSYKKSGVRGMAELDEDFVVGKHESREKHAKGQSQKEFVTGKFSVLKVRKKRKVFIASQDEESMPSKSPSECHSPEAGNNANSSARGCHLADTFDDTVSGRKGIEIHGDYAVIGPFSGVNCGENSMSLSKSLAPEFHKMASPSNTVVFKRSLFGAETPSSATNESLGDEQEMFCGDEVGNVGTGMESKDGQGNYFTEVDPIPIPGPPGSYLPSPRDMGSEDLHGNSSITTSRVQSSEDHHDLVDRDSSDSPISAISTLSNSMIPRSNPKSLEKLSVGPQPAHDAAVGNTSQAPQAERIKLDEMKVNMNFSEKGPISFRNDQPCCCSRKEVVSLNYQDSQLLRRRAMGNQQSCEPNRRFNGLNSTPEVIPFVHFPSSGSEKVAFPITKSAVGPVSADSAIKSPGYGDCESASPSASNVLRLMGKNLMVANKDENVSQHFKQAQLSSLKDHPNQPYQTPNDDFPSFYHPVHQNPLVSGQNQCDMGFEPKLSNCFGNYVSSKTSSNASADVFSSKTQYRNADFTTNPMKQVIIIDDTGDREADNLGATDARLLYGRENRETSAGISIPVAANYNSRHPNLFHTYQPQDSSSPYSGSHTVQKSASFHMPMPPSSIMASSSSSGHLISPLCYSLSFS